MAAGGERAKDLLVSPPPKLSRDEIASQWPLHWYVWHDDVSSLEEELALNRHDKDKKDSRGRTALHLAVSLGYVECVKALLCAGCDANAINNGGWNVSQEAISTGNPELVSLTLQHRDFQRGSQRLAGIPELLDDLNSTPDFYVEMKWEFTSWVPFMSRMCPSDTYKIYKKGANVRVDTTLIGFDQNDWQRGNRSYVFKGEDGGGVFLEIDHDRKAAWKETLKISKDPKNIESTRPSQEMVTQRMTSPIVATMLDTDSIAFTRHKCMWGWGGDRTETIGLFECKVYSATGVEVVTKTRVEHLADDDKKEAKVGPPVIPVGATGLQSLLGIEEEHSPNPLEEDNNGGVVDPNSTNPFHMGVEEYFNPSDKSYTRDIGRIKEMSTKKQKFKATISMADPHPLSLQQQVLPIIKLLAISNAHFAKLRDFVALHLPAGFPVKIEIPLFHVLSAKITFGNINGVENTVRGVTSHDTHPVAIEDISVSTSSDLPNKSSTSAATENDKSMNCCIETACFDVPAGYREIRVGEHLAPIRDEEDELLQLAIQQSLLEYGGFGQDEVSQALKESQREDEELQRAIQESLKMSGIEGNGESEMKIEATGQSPVRQTNHNNEENDEELQMAMVMSEQQMEQDEKLRQQEEDELRKAIELSMTEK